MKKLFLLSLVFLLYGCGYDLNSALRNGDVIDSHGNLENLYKLENFIVDMNSNKESSLRVTQFTEEGDPILIDLSYDLYNGLLMEYDPSRDDYSNLEPFSTQCHSIEHVVDGYYITGCNEIDDIRLVYYMN
ncbi:DUF4362 domain-containing protein [Geomicrobium sp. JSM 1781026]|uniref:DUF4362 domain-containing protein n=1 Tax=Geomicrobium sp. JSM 1781026 TaxID=3344580 RepID=UPI0035BEDAB2